MTLTEIRFPPLKEEISDRLEKSFFLKNNPEVTIIRGLHIFLSFMVVFWRYTSGIGIICQSIIHCYPADLLNSQQFLACLCGLYKVIHWRHGIG